jgi:hypothetical protein
LDREHYKSLYPFQPRDEPGSAEGFLTFSPQKNSFSATTVLSFKVGKPHIERELHPPDFQQQPGYEFYEIDKATRRRLTSSLESGSEFRSANLRRVERVRKYIAVGR